MPNSKNNLSKKKDLSSFDIFVLVFTIILSILFYVLKENRLILGGITLIFIGTFVHFLPGIKGKEINIEKVFFGSITMIFGVTALLLEFIAPFGIDAMISSLLLGLLSWVLIFFILEKNLPILIKRFSLLFFILPITLAFIITIPSILKSIMDEGFPSPYFYVSTIISLIIVVFSLFLIIRWILRFMRIENEYLALGLSFSIFVIISGYSYLTNVSAEGEILRDFLLILSLGFLAVWSSISSLRSILSS